MRGACLCHTCYRMRQQELVALPASRPLTAGYGRAIVGIGFCIDQLCIILSPHLNHHGKSAFSAASELQTLRLNFAEDLPRS